MHISRKLALALIAALLLCGACGTGNRLDMSGDGPGGGQYLPPILQVDSGVVDATPIIPNGVATDYPGITYIDGVLTVPPDAGVAMDFPVGDPNSLPNFALADGTGIASADPTFDTTGDGAADFLIMGIQAMAAQAAANVTVIGPSLANDELYNPSEDILWRSAQDAVDFVNGQHGSATHYRFESPDTFYKVGGAAFLPLDAKFTNHSVHVELQISDRADTANGTLKLYKFLDGTKGASQASGVDIGSGTGVWVHVPATITLAPAGFMVDFDLPALTESGVEYTSVFGQYAVAIDEVTDQSGTGNAAPAIGAVTYTAANTTLTVPVTDVDNDNVTVTVSSPAGLTPDAGSKVVTGGNGSATFTWTGAAGISGDTTITINDGVNTAVTATQTIGIGPLYIASHTYSGTTLTVTVVDTNNADVTVAVSSPAGLTPDAASKMVTGGNGSATFTWSGSGTGDTTITATEGTNTDTATQTITVSSASTVSITSHPYDAQILTVDVTNTNNQDVIVAVSALTGLTPDAPSKTVTGGNGAVTFVWTGATGATGETTITATEGANTDTETQTITIGSLGITALAFSAASKQLTVTVANTANQNVTVGVTALSGLTPDETSKEITNGNGSAVFTWSGTAGATGVTQITVTDGITTVRATHTITLSSTNAAPVIVSHVFTAPTLAVVVTDDVDPVTVTVTVPTGLAVDNAAPAATAAGGGTVNFVWSATVPSAGGSGDTTITITDGVNTPVTATQTITIAGNAAPVIGTPTYVEATGTLTVPVTDTNNDDVDVTVSVPTGLAVDNLTQTVTGGNGNAVFHWTATSPPAGGTGDTTISANDGHNAPVTATQAITVAANAAPVLGTITYVEATGILTVPVTDANNDNVTVTVTVPTGLTVDNTVQSVTGGNGSAVFHWTGAAGATGNAFIIISDGKNPPVTVLQTITIPT